ncbi:MAG: hypothetical protein AAGU75_10540, partial [Bacillota bacterium]
CSALGLGILHIDNAGTATTGALTASDYTTNVYTTGDAITINKAYLDSLNAGIYDLTIAVENGGYEYFDTMNLYVVSTTAIINYNQPPVTGGGVLHVQSYDTNTDTSGATIDPMGSVVVGGSNCIEITYTQGTMRIKNIIITEAYYGFTEPYYVFEDYIQNCDLIYLPFGYTNIQVEYQSIPTLAAITGVRLYRDSELTDEITTTTSSINATDIVYVDVEFDSIPDDMTYINSDWQYRESEGTYESENYIDSTTPMAIDLSKLADIDNKIVKFEVRGIEGYSTGSAFIEFYVGTPSAITDGGITSGAITQPMGPLGLHEVPFAEPSREKIIGTIVDIKQLSEII